MRYPWLDEESDSEITAQVQLVLSAAEQLLVPTLHLSPSGGGGGGEAYSNPDEIELPSGEGKRRRRRMVVMHRCQDCHLLVRDPYMFAY